MSVSWRQVCMPYTMMGVPLSSRDCIDKIETITKKIQELAGITFLRNVEELREEDLPQELDNGVCYRKWIIKAISGLEIQESYLLERPGKMVEVAVVIDYIKILKEQGLKGLHQCALKDELRIQYQKLCEILKNHKKGLEQRKKDVGIESRDSIQDFVIGDFSFLGVPIDQKDAQKAYEAMNVKNLWDQLSKVIYVDNYLYILEKCNSIDSKLMSKIRSEGAHNDRSLAGVMGEMILLAQLGWPKYVEKRLEDRSQRFLVRIAKLEQQITQLAEEIVRIESTA